MDSRRFNLFSSVVSIVLMVLVWRVDLSLGQDSTRVITSCHGRCGTPPNYTSCGCDNVCVDYGDCCIDFQTSCRNNSSEKLISNSSFTFNQFKSEYQLFHRYTSCISVQKLNLSDKYPSQFRMIDKCPQEWRDTEKRKYCERNTRKDVLSSLHVQSSSGLVFKNTFCAFCHGIKVNDVIPWKLIQDRNTSEKRIQVPRSPWSMNLQVCNDENQVYIRNCPNDTSRFLSESCMSFLAPCEDNSTTIFVKNYYCGKCHSIKIKLPPRIIRMPTTFDVIFGARSWTTFKASCYGSEVDRYFDHDIFQNACPLFDLLLNNQGRTPSCDIKSCLSNLTSTLFESEGNNTFRTNIINDSCNSFEAEFILPSRLAFILLNTTINPGNITLRCDVKIKVMLPLEKVPPSCYDKQMPENRDTFLSQPIADIICRNFCHVATTYLTTIDCPDFYSSQLKCHTTEEKTLPLKSFEVIDFAKEQIQYYGTNVSLNQDQFGFTPENKIRTCEIFLHDTFTKVATSAQIVGSIFSMLGVLFVIALHFILPKLQTLYGFCLVNVCFAFFVFFLFLLLNAVAREIYPLAHVFVMLGHYTFLAVVAWQKMIAFHVARSFGKNIIANRMSKISVKKEAILYSAVAWGAPLPFFITGLILHICSCTTFSYGYIWMSPSVPTTILFLLPSTAFVLLSAIWFLIALVNIHRRQHTSRAPSKGKMDNFYIALRLAIVTGLPWCLAIAYAVFPKTFLELLVTAILALQGVFIFFAFVTTQTVRALIFEKLRALHSDDPNNSKNIEQDPQQS